MRRYRPHPLAKARQEGSQGRSRPARVRGSSAWLVLAISPWRGRRRHGCRRAGGGPALAAADRVAALTRAPARARKRGSEQRSGGVGADAADHANAWQRAPGSKPCWRCRCRRRRPAAGRCWCWRRAERWRCTGRACSVPCARRVRPAVRASAASWRPARVAGRAGGGGAAAPETEAELPHLAAAQERAGARGGGARRRRSARPA